jgi:hypothetical protein
VELKHQANMQVIWKEQFSQPCGFQVILIK